jgi:hypothetical protein
LVGFGAAGRAFVPVGAGAAGERGVPLGDGPRRIAGGRAHFPDGDPPADEGDEVREGAAGIDPDDGARGRQASAAVLLSTLAAALVPCLVVLPVSVFVSDLSDDASLLLPPSAPVSLAPLFLPARA